MNNEKGLMQKLAYSKNDYTIPNSICLEEIQFQNNSDEVLWKMSNAITDTNTVVSNIEKFNLKLIYTFANNLGNIGLYCLTGKKNKIIAKFEFYVQKLTQESIDNAINEIKNFCEKCNFNAMQTKLQLAYLNKYLNSKIYQATILIHNSLEPHKSLNTTRHTYYFSKNTQFTNSLIYTYIRKIMQDEHFIEIQ